MRNSRRFALMGMLLCALGAGTSQGQISGSTCTASVPCNGACIPGFECQPRGTLACATMALNGSSGNSKGLGSRCGACTKDMMGIPLTMGLCGSSCVQPCPVDPDDD